MKRLKKMPKLILLSALSAIAFGGIAAGSTYALFTSSAETKTTVTAGKVDVSATVDEASYFTKSLDSEYQEGSTHMYGGSVIFKDGTLSLSNMVPGDAVKFNINVKNNSTVNTKVRTILKSYEDTGLASGLSIKVTENCETTDFKGLAVTDWTETAAKTGDKTFTIEIELPKDANNTYQGKSARLSYSIEAVQGNAKTVDAVVVNSTDESESITTLLNNLKDNAEVYFAPGTYDDNYVFWTQEKKNIKIYGCAGAKFTNLTLGCTTGLNDSEFLVDGINVKNQLFVCSRYTSTVIQNCSASQIYCKNGQYTNNPTTTLTIQNNSLYLDDEYAYDALTNDWGKNGGVWIDNFAENIDVNVLNNTFENYIGHAMKFQGDGTETTIYSKFGTINVSGNNFISYGYLKQDRTKINDGSEEAIDEAAFKIWNDLTYCPNKKPDEESQEIKNKQVALSQKILENNTFSDLVKESNLYVSNFYGKCYDQL